jgi:hypothetical protein
MTIEEFQEIHRIITRLKAKEYQIAYSEASGYSITTKDNKHIRFITQEEYKLIERLIPPQ